MKNLIATIFCLLALTACGDGAAKDVTFTVTGVHKKGDVDIVANALGTFRKSCGPLFKSWGDVTGARATLRESAKGSVPNKFGWKKYLTVEIDVTDDPKTMIRSAAYQTLFYFLGSGVDTGIQATKKPARILCNINETGFRRVPALRPMRTLSAYN
ncbi:hypothetical protein [Varunaivibrio sulfuroxidans]|uniref:Lipoprotein n=1 Tax=Varunaivibrio sulfuroxidans TaxID=1773489 RepID=A0A4R3JD21_9PROT|nr:hypothetical protein [Varunaivibrio sulfuroxidans]TCS62590.1 hypothetical protein EDD55_105136 [Varunaivibrio sulfuroxidans]WES30741.1 hypothetical protein P3M64_14090 [Varunaivibrio sulfuroxidans]